MQETPFTDVHVRRAFAAAFNRTAFINEMMEGQGLAMKQLGPPVIFGALAIEEVGVGYNPEFTLSEIAAAGYPDCQGFPQVTLFISEGWLDPAFEGVVSDWELKLGCAEGTIQIDSTGEVPLHMMWSGWGSDYPDEHNYFGLILSRQFPTPISKRTCNEIDDLIAEAAQEINSEKRIALFAEIEEAFFGEEGEFPLIPVVWSARYAADHTWLERTHPVLGKERFYERNLDMQAKLEARGQQ